jgi:hypothetical protein
MLNTTRAYIHSLDRLSGDDYWSAVQQLSLATDQVASVRDIDNVRGGVPCVLPVSIHDALDSAVRDMGK